MGPTICLLSVLLYSQTQSDSRDKLIQFMGFATVALFAAYLYVTQ